MSRPDPLPGWAQLETAVPQVTDTMRRYLAQMGCVLRPGSVTDIDGALRCFAAFLTEAHPDLDTLGAVRRCHIESFKP